MSRLVRACSHTIAHTGPFVTESLSYRHFAIPFSDFGPDVCTILAADTRPPISEQSVAYL